VYTSTQIVTVTRLDKSASATFLGTIKGTNMPNAQERSELYRSRVQKSQIKEVVELMRKHRLTVEDIEPLLSTYTDNHEYLSKIRQVQKKKEAHGASLKKAQEARRTKKEDLDNGK
jgi:hypothetical protein